MTSCPDRCRFAPHLVNSVRYHFVPRGRPVIMAVRSGRTTMIGRLFWVHSACFVRLLSPLLAGRVKHACKQPRCYTCDKPSGARLPSSPLLFHTQHERKQRARQPAATSRLQASLRICSWYRRRLLEIAREWAPRLQGCVPGMARAYKRFEHRYRVCGPESKVFQAGREGCYHGD